MMVEGGKKEEGGSCRVRRQQGHFLSWWGCQDFDTLAPSWKRSLAHGLIRLQNYETLDEKIQSLDTLSSLQL